MKKTALFLCLGLTILTNDGLSQKRDKLQRYFGEPILTDTLSTIFFPVRYNEGFLSSNKIALWGDYYANIVVYDFKTDNRKKLFLNDTYIKSFTLNNYFIRPTDDKLRNVTIKWVFLLVKSMDYNTSGRIDESDPSILFVTTTKGENLRPLTDGTENVVSLDIYDEQGFGLIKIQKDSNKDKSFKSEDENFYFKKIDLDDLSFGKGIEIE